jgi:hypothetical protein
MTMTTIKSKCLENLTPDREMQVLRSQYVQAILREQGLNISQALATLEQETGRGDTPLHSSGPVLSS